MYILNWIMQIKYATFLWVSEVTLGQQQIQQAIYTKMW